MPDWLKHLHFITNPRLCGKNDPKKSRTSVLLQHLVKAAVIISASPLTAFDIIPFHCPVSTVYRSDNKLRFSLTLESGTIKSFLTGLGRNQVSLPKTSLNQFSKVERGAESLMSQCIYCACFFVKCTPSTIKSFELLSFEIQSSWKWFENVVKFSFYQICDLKIEGKKYMVYALWD